MQNTKEAQDNGKEVPATKMSLKEFYYKYWKIKKPDGLVTNPPHNQATDDFLDKFCPHCGYYCTGKSIYCTKK